MWKNWKQITEVLEPGSMNRRKRGIRQFEKNGFLSVNWSGTPQPMQPAENIISSKGTSLTNCRVHDIFVMYYGTCQWPWQGVFLGELTKYSHDTEARVLNWKGRLFTHIWKNIPIPDWLSKCFGGYSFCLFSVLCSMLLDSYVPPWDGETILKLIRGLQTRQ